MQWLSVCSLLVLLSVSAPSQAQNQICTIFTEIKEDGFKSLILVGLAQNLPDSTLGDMVPLIAEALAMGVKCCSDTPPEDCDRDVVRDTYHFLILITPHHPYHTSSSLSYLIILITPHHPYHTSSSLSHLIILITPHHPYHTSSSLSHLIILITPHHPYHTSSSLSHNFTFNIWPAWPGVGRSQRGARGRGHG
uniref:Receptor ligand binding region domain-containing protein n=1 Tax=Hucho hucho TaxID=62062 RepID=A0A4W5JKX2_9TELE